MTLFYLVLKLGRPNDETTITYSLETTESKVLDGLLRIVLGLGFFP